jgi:hypothetical protein
LNTLACVKLSYSLKNIKIKVVVSTIMKYKVRDIIVKESKYEIATLYHNNVLGVLSKDKGLELNELGGKTRSLLSNIEVD